MNKKRAEYIKRCEVSQVKEYELGGYKQKVVFDGLKSSSPILLYLHGGPGFPIPFCEGSRGTFPDFSDHFIMVYWDQLGCGINNHLIDDTFTIAHFVNMTIDLIRYIKKDYPNNKIILLGVSWGSVLALEASAKAPELIDYTVTYGQITKQLFFNNEVYHTLEGAKLPEKDRKIMEELKGKSSHDNEDVKILAKSIMKYTNGYIHKEGEKIKLWPLIYGILESPDYTFKNFVAMVKNGSAKNKSIWEELLEIDLTNDLLHLQKPYLMIQGNSDIVTSTTTVKSFMEQNDLPNITLKIVEKSGHIPGVDAISKILFNLMSIKDSMN